MKSIYKISVSLVIITLNEEHNIARCIKSAPWVNDIVVLDSGSEDRTLEIAQSLGARVYQEQWRGYGLQKRRATELAKNDWILSLDADEALSPELLKETYELFIRSQKVTFNEISKYDSYAMPRKTFHLGRWINHGGWYPDCQVRLFNRKKCEWSKDILHESVKSSNTGKLKHDLQHFAFGSLSEQVRINNKYSSLAVKKLKENGKAYSLYSLIVKPPIKFIECYFLKLGFMDGIVGFIIAVGAAYSHFLRYAKLWESKYVAVDLAETSQQININLKSDFKKRHLRTSKTISGLDLTNH